MTALLKFYCIDGVTRSCDARCHLSRSHACDCICHGQNHGIGYAAAVDNTNAHALEWLRLWNRLNPTRRAGHAIDVHANTLAQLPLSATKPGA